MTGEGWLWFKNTIQIPSAPAFCVGRIKKPAEQLHAHPSLPLGRSNAASWFCPCVSNKCCQYGRLCSTLSHGAGTWHRRCAPAMTSKTPAAPHTQLTDRRRRLPDVNKHWSVLPSKRLSHCCGQRCLACVMSDDVAGSALVVLMYSGAFHDLLKGCGEGGVCSTTVLNLHRSKSSVKTDNRVIWYQRSFWL